MLVSISFFLPFHVRFGISPFPVRVGVLFAFFRAGLEVVFLCLALGQEYGGLYPIQQRSSKYI